MSDVYGPPELVTELRWAEEVFAAGPKHPAHELFASAHEFPTHKNSEVSIYAQFRGDRVVYMIGEPGWDPKA